LKATAELPRNKVNRSDIRLFAAKDAVLLESVDGRPHLEQVKPVLAAKKPVFIDKPLAASYRDAKEIARLAREAGVPWFSSSSLRFWDETKRLKAVPEAGRILGANVYGPAPTESHHPDLMWYGIHAVEMLFAVMGPGCESVSRVNTEGTDIVTGKWKDGRLGVVRGIRKGKQAYGIGIFGEKAILHSEDKPSGYRPLLVEIVKFFQRASPVNPETWRCLLYAGREQGQPRSGGTVGEVKVA
jgi:predicted dehydrogenase